MTVKHRQVSAVLQQHIGCTAASDTEAAVIVGTTHDCTGIGDDSPSTVLGNLRG